MVASFITSAGLTLSLTIVCLVLKGQNDPDAVNPWDNYLRRKCDDWVRHWMSKDRANRWSECLRDVVLTLSDSQLVTGIAILASAIKLMNDGTIVVYHFNLVIDLAWFSSNTHLLSLLVITSFMDGEEDYNTALRGHAFTHNDILRYVRVLMVILAALLLYCSYVSGFSDWYDQMNCPALCIKNQLQANKSNLGGCPLQWMIVNFVLVLSSYPFYIIGTFPVLRQLIRDFFRPRFESLKNKDNCSTPIRWLNYGLCGFVAFWFSDLEAILELIAWFALGMYWTIGDRYRIRSPATSFPNGTPLISDSEWNLLGSFGFGQMVPLFLLLLPLLTLIESWKGKILRSTTLSRIQTDGFLGRKADRQVVLKLGPRQLPREHPLEEL